MICMYRYIYYTYVLNETISFDLCSPEYFSYESLLGNDTDTNLEHAFHVAHEKLGIEKLLDAEGKVLCCLCRTHCVILFHSLDQKQTKQLVALIHVMYYCQMSMF